MADPDMVPSADLAALSAAAGDIHLLVGADGLCLASTDPAVRTGLVWGLGLTLLLTLVTAQTLSGMDSQGASGTPDDAAGLWLLGWSRDGGDLRAAHFFANHAMHAVPLAALLCARLFGPSARAPVRIAALAYAGFVAIVFVQALRGLPLIPF